MWPTDEDRFQDAGYYPFFLFALETAHVTPTTLCDVVREGLTGKGFNGLIITSQRSCEAFGKAFGLLEDEDQSGVGIQNSVTSFSTLISDF
jgi:uroporphyrinogen-III synthase